MSGHTPVPYRVECAVNGASFYEVIAAFNVQRVALQYATDCQLSNPQNCYRVTERKRVLHDAPYISAEAILQKRLGKPV